MSTVKARPGGPAGSLTSVVKGAPSATSCSSQSSDSIFITFAPRFVTSTLPFRAAQDGSRSAHVHRPQAMDKGGLGPGDLSFSGITGEAGRLPSSINPMPSIPG